MFDRIGLYEKIEPRGIIAPVFHYWDRHENALIAAFDHIHLKDDTRFPYVLQCERIKIVEEALKMAKAHPLIDLRLRTTFTAFEQDADGVTAHLTNPAGEDEVIKGRYIVSGEGARSIIRKDLGIDFEGFTYPDRTLNIEVAYDFRKHGYAERNYISDPDEWSNLFHWKGPPDRWRVHFPTAPGDDPDAITRPDALQARLKRFLPTGRDFDIVASNLYTVHQRVAKTFRVGRVVLAGDCAHVNSPIGAMGMDSGIHDAFNQLVGGIEGIVDAVVHAQGADRTIHVRAIARQDNASDPERLRHPLVHGVEVRGDDVEVASGGKEALEARLQRVRARDGIRVVAGRGGEMHAPAVRRPFPMEQVGPLVGIGDVVPLGIAMVTEIVGHLDVQRAIGVGEAFELDAELLADDAARAFAAHQEGAANRGFLARRIDHAGG